MKPNERHCPACFSQNLDFSADDRQFRCPFCGSNGSVEACIDSRTVKARKLDAEALELPEPAAEPAADLKSA